MKKLLFFLIMTLSTFYANSQCFNGDLFPSTNVTVTCGGSGWSISNAWPGEYSNINVVAGNQYTFSSSVSTDFITISNSAGNSSLQTGVGSVSYTPSFTGTLRFYRHLSSQCGTNTVNRTVTVTCSTSVPGGNLTFYFGELTSYESENLIEGENISVPVRTLGFQNIGSFQFTILLGPCATFRSTPPTIVGLSNIHPGLVFNSYDINPEGTQITFTWFTSTSLSLANATKLFDIIIEGPGNGQSATCCDNLYFTDTPVEIRAFNNLGAEMNVITTDYHGICDAPVRICGCIIRENGDPVGNVTVELFSDGVVVDEDLTGADGCYEFNDLNLGFDYLIQPSKLINPKNGVDINDASLVAQYAGNKPSLNSPYKIVSADVIFDASQKVSVNDAQLIARVAAPSAPNDFGQQPSWKFVISEYEFPVLPLTGSYNDDFPQFRFINNIDGDYCDENFIGMKLGDINLSANPQNVQGGNQSRSLASGFLSVDPVIQVEDSVFTLNIKAGSFQGVKDFQLGFTWDKNQIEYLSYAINEFGIPESSLAGIIIDGDSIAKADGRLYLGWYDFQFKPEGVSLQSEDIIAKITFKLKDLSLNELNFGQDSTIEAFYTNHEDRRIPVQVEFKNIEIDIISGTLNTYIDRNYKVFPTISSGLFHVQTLESEEYILEMYDLNGRQIQREIHSGDTSLEIRNYISGQYLLKITEVQSGETGTFRIIKK
jgi:hypothetical protein